MRGRTADSSTEVATIKDVTRAAGQLATRKVWLPKAIYDALPYFYFGAGVAAFLATIYINEWFWVLPHYVLFAVGCLHLGVVIYRRRERARHDDSPERGEPSA